MGGDCRVKQRKIYRCCCYALLPSPRAAASAVHAIAAAAGEILGELQQRFMSCLPAGGLLRLGWVSEAHTGKDGLGNGHTATAVDFHKIMKRKCCLNGCKFEPKVPNNHKFKHNLLFPPVPLLAGAAAVCTWLNCFTGFPIWSFSSKQGGKRRQMCRCFAM